MHPLGIVDLIIVALFLAYSVRNGLRSRKTASLNLEEYFLAGRGLSRWQAGISMAATQFAADTPLLVTGLIATGGIFALWQLWIYGLAFFALAFIFAASWRRVRVLTDAELTEVRYGGTASVWLRGIKALYFGTVFNCIVLAWVLYAAARIAEPFLPWNEWLPSWLFTNVQALVEWVGVPLAVDAGAESTELWLKTANNLISVIALLIVTTFYSTTGGLRSVVATDVAQFVIMMGATILYAATLVGEIGGFGALHERLGSIFYAGNQAGIEYSELLAFTPWHAKGAAISILLLFGLQWLIQINADGTGYLAQRAMACRSDADARDAAVIFAFLQVLLRSLVWIVIGLSLLVVYPPESSPMLQPVREITYVRGIAELLPVGLKGAMVTAMFAAFASTVDSHLNWGAAYWTNDIFKRLICEKMLKKTPAQRTLVCVARFSNVLLVVLALLIATQLGSINEAWQTSLLFGAGLGPVLVLRWIWWRVTAVSELAALLFSLCAAPILMTYVEDSATRLLLASAISSTAMFAAVFFGPREKKDKLIEFYKRARPPGFWEPIAGLCGERRTLCRDRLRGALKAVLFAAITLFFSLVGLGSFLAGSPAPDWFPLSDTLWVVLLLVVALLSIPIWLKPSSHLIH